MSKVIYSSFVLFCFVFNFILFFFLFCSFFVHFSSPNFTYLPIYNFNFPTMIQYVLTYLLLFIYYSATPLSLQTYISFFFALFISLFSYFLYCCIFSSQFLEYTHCSPASNLHKPKIPLNFEYSSTTFSTKFK